MPAPATRHAQLRSRRSTIRPRVVQRRPPQRVAEWVIRSLVGEESGERRVLLWLTDPHLQKAMAFSLRQRGLDVQEATGPSAELLGQRFTLVVLDLAVERSLELGHTMQLAEYADAIIFVTTDEALADSIRDIAPGEVEVARDVRGLVRAACTALEAC